MSQLAPVLLLNINNTFTKAALWEGGRLRFLGRKPSSRVESADFQRWMNRKRPGRILIASVVPEVTRIIPRPPVPCHTISYRSPLGCAVRFPRPRTIGADRLANAAAVCAFYQTPAVVVDFGTAVTFDVISGQKEYLGGVIAPGMRVFRDYLAERTALLPKIRLEAPRGAIGQTTRQAMQIGAFHGYRGLVREILKEIRRELGVKRLVILTTGGDSDLFQEMGIRNARQDPDLTFRGMGVIADLLKVRGTEHDESNR